MGCAASATKPGAACATTGPGPTGAGPAGRGPRGDRGVDRAGAPHPGMAAGGRGLPLPPRPEGPGAGRAGIPDRRVGPAACHRRASGPGLEPGPTGRSALERPPAHPAATAPRPSPLGRHDRPRPPGGPLRGGLADRSDRRPAPLGRGRGCRRSDAPGRRPGRDRANGLELEPPLLADVAGRGAHRATHRHVGTFGLGGRSAASRSATSR